MKKVNEEDKKEGLTISEYEVTEDEPLKKYEETKGDTKGDTEEKPFEEGDKKVVPYIQRQSSNRIEDIFNDNLYPSDSMNAELLIVLVGDDLLTTHPERLQKAIDSNACNAILIKPNQIGTITETVEVMNIAKQNNIYTIVSLFRV